MIAAVKVFAQADGPVKLQRPGFLRLSPLCAVQGGVCVVLEANLGLTEAAKEPFFFPRLGCDFLLKAYKGA